MTQIVLRKEDEQVKHQLISDLVSRAVNATEQCHVEISLVVYDKMLGRYMQIDTK